MNFYLLWGVGKSYSPEFVATRGKHFQFSSSIGGKDEAASSVEGEKEIPSEIEK
jgi:hypothetical protein